MQDRKESWPNDLESELDGFIYNRLGGFGGTGAAEMADRKSSWFEDWLTKDKTYSPQPYEQLAKVLRTAGQYGKADDILYAGRERERAEATGPKWIGLTLLNYSIGYGYRYLYSLIWIAVLVGLGAVVLCRTGEGKKHKMPYGIAYSVDMLLPIVRLREYHFDGVKLLGFARYYFYFHKLMGYMLASFLIAGLSGLTQ